MKMHHAIAVALCGVPCIAHAARAQTATWSSVDSILGRSGAPQAGDVMRYGFPRGDLSVTANGVKLKPAFALGSWVAFKRGESHAMAMGDLVLTETEIAPVMKELQSGGVMQTALHNHVLGESPRIMYMHIEAHGDDPSSPGTDQNSARRSGASRSSASRSGHGGYRRRAWIPRTRKQRRISGERSAC